MEEYTLQQAGGELRVWTTPLRNEVASPWAAMPHVKPFLSMLPPLTLCWPCLARRGNAGNPRMLRMRTASVCAHSRDEDGCHAMWARARGA